MSSEKNVPALLVMIEPAPYMTRLSELLQAGWAGPVKTVFVLRHATQRWEEGDSSPAYEVLPQGTLAAAWRLLVLMFSIRPAIVHVAGWSHSLVVASIIIARLRGACVIASSDTWVSRSGRLRTFLKRCTLSWVTRFTPAGARQAAYLQSHGVPASRIYQAHMTVDVESIRAFHRGRGQGARLAFRDRHGIKPETVLFLFVGRLSPEKGVQLLLDAFAHLRVHGNVHLLIVGDGPDRSKLEQHVGVATGVTFAGRLSGDELLAAYAAGDVFVGPSLRESWGLVINEAMAAGLPVIVSDAFGCIDDLLPAGTGGVVVPADDEAALAHAMERLANDRALREHLGETGERLISSWTMEAQVCRIQVAWCHALGMEPRFLDDSERAPGPSQEH